MRYLWILLCLLSAPALGAYNNPIPPDQINSGYHVATATLTKTSDAALATITGLSITGLQAGKTYSCRGHLRGTSGATGGFKVALTASGGLSATSIAMTAVAQNGAALVTAGTVSVTALGTLINVAAIYTDIFIEGAIVVNAAGDMLVQGAQSVSNGTATTFLLNSTFQCVRVN